MYVFVRVCFLCVLVEYMCPIMLSLQNIWVRQKCRRLKALSFVFVSSGTFVFMCVYVCVCALIKRLVHVLSIKTLNSCAAP